MQEPMIRSTAKKDYARETQFALDRLQKVTAAKNLRILDIGCGTGLHDVYLATAGHTVKGLDTSAGMLALAEDRRAGLPADVRNRLSFQAEMHEYCGWGTRSTPSSRCFM